MQMHNLVNNPSLVKLRAKLDAILQRKLKQSSDLFLPAEAYLSKYHYPVDSNGTVPYAP
jgi:hypothetical protein